MSAVIVSVHCPIDKACLDTTGVSGPNILSLQTAYKQEILKLMVWCETDD